jgi:hypothetical protein
MKIDNEPMLETDHLEQLLETPAPSPPVVVVQYRNRGVPSWIFFPLMLLIPFGAIWFYHRTVVERYRVQAAQDRSLILRKMEAERALQPLVRDNGPSTTVLPTPNPDTAAPSTGDDSGSSVNLTAAALARVADEMKAASDSNPPTSGADAGGSSAPTTASRVGSASPNPTGIVGQSGPTPNLHPVSGSASLAKLPAPTDGVGSTAIVDNAEKTSPDLTGDLANKTGQGAADGPQPVGTPGSRRTDTVAPSSGGLAAIGAQAGDHSAGTPDPAVQVPAREERIGPQPLPALPTKEEERRAVEEEADRRAAQIVAQHENKKADLRSRWLEEQTKFRQELDEIVRAKRNQAGPDIASLDKRYAYQGDPILYQFAYEKWRNSRNTEKSKVDFIRKLELPETVILEFMCASLHGTIGKRSGPRDENEVRVRAARMLLKYDLPKAVVNPNSR